VIGSHPNSLEQQLSSLDPHESLLSYAKKNISMKWTLTPQIMCMVTPKERAKHPQHTRRSQGELIFGNAPFQRASLFWERLTPKSITQPKALVEHFILLFILFFKSKFM
jgi:hypothetical protein